jgi:hypothetical protein
MVIVKITFCKLWWFFYCLKQSWSFGRFFYLYCNNIVVTSSMFLCYPLLLLLLSSFFCLVKANQEVAEISRNVSTKQDSETYSSSEKNNSPTCEKWKVHHRTYKLQKVRRILPKKHRTIEMSQDDFLYAKLSLNTQFWP